MKLPAYQFVTQMGAAFAVVASLGLVAYELKQTRDMAVGELALSVYEVESSVYLQVLDAEAYNRAVDKLENGGGELTWSERKNLFRVIMASNGVTIAKFQLWKLGLLSDTEWEWEVQKVKNNWTDVASWRETMYTGNYQNSEFIKMLDDVTTEWEAERGAD